MFSVENVIGSRFADQLTGDRGDNVLEGGAGDDTITGGAGRDTFVFSTGDGSDTITDFGAGASWWWLSGRDHDRIDLDVEGFEDFASIAAAASQVGDDTVIDFGESGAIVLEDFAVEDLTAEMFI